MWNRVSIAMDHINPSLSHRMPAAAVVVTLCGNATNISSPDAENAFEIYHIGLHRPPLCNGRVWPGHKTVDHALTKLPSMP